MVALLGRVFFPWGMLADCAGDAACAASGGVARAAGAGSLFSERFSGGDVAMGGSSQDASSQPTQWEDFVSQQQQTQCTQDGLFDGVLRLDEMSDGEAGSKVDAFFYACVSARISQKSLRTGAPD